MNPIASLYDLLNTSPQTRPILGGVWLLAYVVKSAVPEHTVAHKVASTVFELLGGAAVLSLGAPHASRPAPPEGEV